MQPADIANLPSADILFTYLVNYGFAQNIARLINTVVNAAIVIVLCWLAYRVVKLVLNGLVKILIAPKHKLWADLLTEHKIPGYFSHIGPIFILSVAVPALFAASPAVIDANNSLMGIYFVIIATAVIMASLSLVLDGFKHTKFANKIHIKGVVQAIKILLIIVSLILILSVLFRKSPLYFFSGLGALTAVMMIVFKDSILGLVASVQLSVNEMVEVGDWIEVPKHNADGDVVDISLTTVKVLNWDNTISTIPSYDLVQSSFKNWRSMSRRGGRRIKRAVYIDTESIKFVDQKLLQRISKIDVMQDFINKRLAEMEDYNANKVKNKDMIVNMRKFTNIGLLRYYLQNYLQNSPIIHKNMTLLVRQLAPTSEGLPLEIYAFTSDTRWVFYEAAQSDIFDHIYAVLPEFELRAFQQPSGSDIRLFSKALLAEDSKPGLVGIQKFLDKDSKPA